MEPSHDIARRPRRLARNPVVWLAALALGVGIVALVDQQASKDKPHRGSGVVAAESRAVGPFTTVELAGANDVAIRVGRERSVTVHGDDNLLSRVTTEVRSGCLVIGTRGSFETVAPMTVAVTAPTLAGMALTGSGRMTALGVEAPSFSVALRGTGAVYATGRATAVRTVLAGSGSIEAERLVTRDARAIVAGSGEIWVNATRSLTATVAGVGAVFYSGNPPHVTTDVAGTGMVTARAAVAAP